MYKLGRPNNMYYSATREIVYSATRVYDKKALTFAQGLDFSNV